MPAFAGQKDRQRFVVSKKKSLINCASCYVPLCVNKRQCFTVYHEISADMLEAMIAKPIIPSNSKCSSASSTTGHKQHTLET